MSEHTPTPTPWGQEDEGPFICGLDGLTICNTVNSPRSIDEDLANAAFIVRAVNAHDDLVRACKEAALVISDIAKAFGQNAMTGTCLPRLLAAIKLAEA